LGFSAGLGKQANKQTRKIMLSGPTLGGAISTFTTPRIHPAGPSFASLAKLPLVLTGPPA
jgi:hypothetical protein